MHLCPHSSQQLLIFCFHSFAFSQVLYSWNIQYVAISDRFLLFTNIHLRFLLVFHGFIAYFMNNILLSECDSLFICSPTKGYLGFFNILAVMDKDTVNIHVQIFVWTLPFQLLWVNTKECDCWFV